MCCFIGSWQRCKNSMRQVNKEMEFIQHYTIIWMFVVIKSSLSFFPSFLMNSAQTQHSGEQTRHFYSPLTINLSWFFGVYSSSRCANNSFSLNWIIRGIYSCSYSMQAFRRTLKVISRLYKCAVIVMQPAFGPPKLSQTDNIDSCRLLSLPLYLVS